MQAGQQRISLGIEGAHVLRERLLGREWPAAQFNPVSTCCTPVLALGSEVRKAGCFLSSGRA